MAAGTQHRISPNRNPGARRPTYPLQQHLPHVPERPHAPFDLNHSPDIHTAQIDIATRSRNTLAANIKARPTLR